jgi:hypothetical protein
MGLSKNAVLNLGATDKQILRLFARSGGCLSVALVQSGRRLD